MLGTLARGMYSVLITVMAMEQSWEFSQTGPCQIVDRTERLRLPHFSLLSPSSMRLSFLERDKFKRLAKVELSRWFRLCLTNVWMSRFPWRWRRDAVSLR